jgi:cytoskeletal protein CcmA (bactofilin family)
MAVLPNTKIVRCCHCGGMMRVSTKAMSVFCPHCQKRAPLESLRITGAHPGRALFTCGDIHIEPTARLNLDIYATTVIVNGWVRGGVTAGQSIEVGATGYIIGDIKAPKIVVHDGGIIQGRIEMNRRAETQHIAESPAV